MPARRNSDAIVDDASEIAAALVAWYRRHQRDLPWRRTRDPYAIWISEIMLQQTRVETVAPRWQRWLTRFPTVRALADAALDDVLAEWAGLGYYARARNLHRAAHEIVARHGGAIPDDPDAIRALPGVGRYTAGAILSIAYDRPAPILDGNVIRVLTRVHRLDGDPTSPELQRRLWSLAGELVERAPPSEVNQALMELGATVCTPRGPTCLVCPVTDRCAARRHGDAERYPGARKATKVLALAHAAIALEKDGKLLLARRPAEGLWGGLHELPTVEIADGEAPESAARRAARERVGLQVDALSPIARFEHVLTHRRITVHAYRAAVSSSRVRRTFYDAHTWLPATTATRLGVSRATRRILDALAPHKEQ